MIKKNIRKYCLWCVDNQSGEIRLCPVFNCAFHLIRSGKNPNGIIRLKAIALRCSDCGEGSRQSVGKCEIVECPLFPYRMGRNPLRKGIGDKDALKHFGSQNMSLSREKKAKTIIQEVASDPLAVTKQKDEDSISKN